MDDRTAELEEQCADEKRAEEQKKGALPATGPSTAKDLHMEADDIVKDRCISANDVSESAVQEPLTIKPDDAVSTIPLARRRRQMSVLGMSTIIRANIPVLELSKITHTDISPREVMRCSRQTQTPGLHEDDQRDRGYAVDDDRMLSDTAQQVDKPAGLGSVVKQEVSEAVVDKPSPTDDECRQVN